MQGTFSTIFFTTLDEYQNHLLSFKMMSSQLVARNEHYLLWTLISGKEVKGFSANKTKSSTEKGNSKCFKPFRLSGHVQVRFQLRAHTACWPLVKSYSNTLSWISKLKGHGK